MFTEPLAMTRITIAALSLLAVTVSAQPPLDILSGIRAEGTEHSQAQRVFDVLTVDIGPRLTASPAHKTARSTSCARNWRHTASTTRMSNRGSSVAAGRSRSSPSEMIEPRYLPLIGYADGWSGGDRRRARWPRRCSSAARSPEEVEAMRAQLKRRHRHDAADADQFRAQGSAAAERPELRAELGRLRHQRGPR